MQRMSGLEFAYWRQQYRREPFGYDIENFRMGQVAAAVVNVTRTRKQDAVTASDFYPSKPKQRHELTPRQRKQLEQKRNGKRRNSNG